MGNTQIQMVISEAKRVQENQQENHESLPCPAEPINTTDTIQQIQTSVPEVEPEENFLKDIYNGNKISASQPCLLLHKELRHHPSAFGQNHQASKFKLAKVMCTDQLAIDKNQKVHEAKEPQIQKNNSSMTKLEYKCTIEDIQSENTERRRL